MLHQIFSLILIINHQGASRLIWLWKIDRFETAIEFLPGNEIRTRTETTYYGWATFFYMKIIFIAF